MLTTQHLPWMVCAVMVAIGVPALARGEERPRAVDAVFVTGDNYFQDAGGDVNDHTVEITPGGTVTFRSQVRNENQGVHSVDFVFDGPQPSVCNQTLAPPDTQLDTDGVAPMPAGPQQPPWEGYCTFNSPGTYRFFCQAHGGMEGTVVVSGGATPTATATATATPTPPAAAARVDAHDTVSPVRNWFQERGSSENDNSVTIKSGERVAFAFPAGSVVHNVAFPSGPSPASCPQTKAGPGIPLDPNDAPPLPTLQPAHAIRPVRCRRWKSP